MSLVLEIKGAADFKALLGTGLDITIAGDNDFYSQQEQVIHTLQIRMLLFTR